MALSNRLVLVLIALNGLLAVVCGAFAAHVVSDSAARELLRTGAAYQLAHAAAAAAVLNRSRWSALLMSIGALIFATSLYLLALSGWRALGVITPLGGALMIIGWGVLLGFALRSPESVIRKSP